MTIENFSCEAKSLEHGSNLYAQVSSNIGGALEVAKQNCATASNYLPEVELQDLAVHMAITPARLGGDERRKAAENQPKQQEQKDHPKDSTPQEKKPQEQPKDATPQQEKKPQQQPKDGTPQQEKKPQEQPKDGTPQQEKKPQQQPKDGTPQQEKKPQQQPKDGTPQQEKKPQQQPKDSTPQEKKPQEQPKRQGPNGPDKQENPKDCVDYGSRGAKVMEKPTTWKPDTELKSKQAQDWNNHAKELRNKPLKTDKDGNYDVQYGDSLWGIAERSVKGRTGKAATPAETFAEMKRIVGMNADQLGSQSNWQMIKPGMKLKIQAENPCEVPSQGQPPKERPRVAQTDAPKDRPPVNQNGSPGERPRVAQTDAPKDRPGVVQTERTTVGDKGQKVTADAQNRITKIDYPNGNHVKFEYSGTSKEISKATVTGNGQNVEMVKNGDHYKVLENGKETSDKVLSISVNKDGSAIITGTSYGMKGQKIVRTDGSTENKYLGAA